MARTCDKCSASTDVESVLVDLVLAFHWKKDLCLRCRNGLAEVLKPVLDNFQPPPAPTSGPRFSGVCVNQQCSWETTNYDNVPLTGCCPQCGMALPHEGTASWPFFVDGKRYTTQKRRMRGLDIRATATSADVKLYADDDSPEQTPVEDDEVVDLANFRRFYSQSD